MHTEKVWKQILKRLESDIDRKTMSKWFESISLKSIDNDTLTLETPNRFVSDWVNKNYRKNLEAAARNVVGQNISISFKALPASAVNDQEHAAAENEFNEARVTTLSPTQPAPEGLNQDLRFENFVVGRSNQFAHAASLAVAQKKARNYNPLFIYGGVGLGKTHLLNAVGNEIFNRRPKVRIISIQAEAFLNEMIRALRSEEMEAFRRKYRKDCDVLLMDDIEILAGKERTQEEFFYTFNDLYGAGKKIVITSDKFPREMNTLEERLRSRFESGIIVDIQPPEFETRMAIVKAKAESYGINVPDDVAYFLAERVRSNIRKLEGCIIRLSAVSSLSGAPISMELAEEVMMAVLDEVGAALSPDRVMKNVAIHFKIKVSDLKSPKRNRKYALPRQIAMYICREMCKMSYPEIGTAFGGRDHSTVIHAVKKIGIDKNTDYELKRAIETLMRKLKQSE